VLDGGWAKWLREGRAIRTGAETRAPATFVANPRKEMLVSVENAVRHLGDPAVLFVDARSPDRFAGRPDPLDNVPGHIPGARNRYYKDNVGDEGVLRTPDALRKDFERVLGAQSPDQIVMYCGSGITACHNLLAMEQAGLTGAKLFAGSWSEWESDPGRPVERQDDEKAS